MKPIKLQIENYSTDKAISFLLNLSPWLAPLSSMQITIENMVNRLNYWTPIAVATGFSIEVLGMATLHTALTFYQHNRRYTDEKNKIPLWVPILAFGFYLILVMGIVILLEWPIQDERVKLWIELGVKGLLVLLSIPAGLVIVSRELHKDTLAKLSRAKKPAAQVSENEPAPAFEPAQVSEKPAQVSENKKETAQVYENWKKVPDHIRREIAGLSHWTEAQTKFPYLKEKTLQNWLRYAKELFPQP